MRALLLLSVAGPALAQPDRDYDKTIERAVTAYNDGDYDEATRQFQRAHERSPNARTFRGIGMSEFELGHHDRAAEALKDSLASDVAPLEGDLRRETERLLREALARVARIRLEIEPGGSEIALDGAPRKLDDNRVLLVSPGPHLLELSAPGYDNTRQPIKVEAGRMFELKLTLVPLKGEAESKRERRLYKSPWLWVGVGVVVIVGAVVGGLVASGKFDKGADEPDTSTGKQLTTLSWSSL